MKTATESQLSVLFDGSNGLNAIKKELEKNSFPEHAIFFTISHSEHCYGKPIKCAI